MKVVFYVLTSIVLFLVVLSFYLQNPHDIEIYYYFGLIWDGPIAILLLLTFAIGTLFGVFASSLRLLKLKIRLRNVAKKLRALELNHKQITKSGN